MQLQITDAGLVELNKGSLIHLDFKLGSSFGFVPDSSDLDIHGTVQYEGSASDPHVINANTVKYSIYLSYDVGPFDFGEVGLYFNDAGTTKLFALGSNADSLVKLTPTDPSGGSSILIDMYLKSSDGSFNINADVLLSNNAFQAAILTSVDQLPRSSDAIPNLYIVQSLDSSQSAILAYTDKKAFWNFDSYAFANNLVCTVVSSTPTSITIDASDYSAELSPEYYGQLILEFSSGPQYSICRYIQSTVLSGATATINFNTALLQLPAVGDKLKVFQRNAFSTSNQSTLNLPIAGSAQLGGVKVGNTMTIDGAGILNLKASVLPVVTVTSVNSKIGAVVLTINDISGASTVARTGSYNDLLDQPNIPIQYTLPTASKVALGGVKLPVDNSILIDGNGVISIGTLSNAVTSINGLTGDVLLTANNVTGLATVAKTGDYMDLVNRPGIPAAQVSSDWLANAGIQRILNKPVLANVATTGNYNDLISKPSIPAAQVQPDWNASSGLGVILNKPNITSYTLPTATTSVLGGVIVGAGLSVAAGVISTSASVTSINGKTGAVVITSVDIGDLADVARTGNYNDLLSKPTIPPAAIGLVNPTLIPNGSDLNTYKTPGLFYSAASSILTNSPVASIATSLEVISINADTLQRQTSASGVYYRLSIGASWGVWTKYLISSDVGPASTSALGLVRIGTGITVDVNGVISYTPPVVAQPYDISGSIAGSPITSGLIITRFPAARAFTLPASLAGSVASCATGSTATASTTLTVHKNSIQFGTIVFDIGATNATFTGTAQSFAIGDVLTVKAASPADTTLGDLGFTLVAQN